MSGVLSSRLRNQSEVFGGEVSDGVDGGGGR